MRSIRKLLPALGAAMLLSGSLYTTSASAVPVSVFQNSSYVDMVSGPAFSEGITTAAALTSLGHAVNSFTGIAAADWLAAAAAVGPNGWIVIPELEVARLDLALTAAAKAAIVSHVTGGGGLIVHGTFSNRDGLLLNELFGFGLVSTDTSTAGTLDAAEAAGTPFVGGPSPLPAYSFTPGVTRASLPGSALDLYHDATQNTLFTVGFGAGRVARMGWDFFNAAPTGTNGAADWLPVYDRLIGFAVPEPGTLALLGLGLAGLGAVGRRRRSVNAATA